MDTLVLRGYLDRSPDPNDRRRLTISLTERGHAADAAIQTAVDRVDEELRERVGVESMRQARAVLGALGEIRDERRARQHEHR